MKRLIAVMIGVFGLLGSVSEAADFNVQLVHPSEQKDISVGYLDIPAVKGETITYQVKVKNNEEEPIKLSVTLTNANSSTNGVIDYGFSREISQSRQAPFDITEVIHSDLKEKELRLEAGEERFINYTVSVPEPFKGVMAGGMNVKELPDDTQKGVVNLIQRTISIFLHGEKIENRKELTLDKTSVSMVNRVPVLSVTLDNANGLFIKSFDMSAKITSKENDVQVKSNPLKEESLYNIAPYTKTTLELPLNEDEMKKLEQGDYPVDITVRTEKNKWKFNSEVKIKDNLSKEIAREESLKNVKEPLDKKILVIIALGIVVVLLIVLLIKGRASK
ncbi:DUF916 and DUF3324 domain-containing protein [Vagococcus sp. PNs007]|uniref:DUF916 and DUF3324 domain-containing protein n=1 Tax=Vagococcus proximus TaxID=2991417 RepID=A0ABT5WZJ2_9ENTE|nr:DUF916 domain-containing protein [Vagococcus proximus]MDF0479185.1 DUF916 and DUF3324 domain-containing protein [Vagococcus proximus]